MSRRRSEPPKWLKAARAQNRSPSRTKLDWLARALARAGAVAPDEISAAIESGRVRVNGRVQTQPLAAIHPGDQVTLDRQPVNLTPATRVLMFHKPAGVICSAKDPEGQGTVFEVFQRALPLALQRFGWHAIGRLDRNTTGLLLFTNDERLVAHGTSPQSHLPKRYVARVSGQLNDEKLEPLRRGMMLDDGPTRPAEAVIREGTRDVVQLTLTEGRHHQVKRMLGAVGLPVLELHREAVGTLVLDVPVGQQRELSGEEISEKLRYSPP